MKRIIICADDYGQNSAISQAIVGLLKENRLSATSCLVTSSEWQTHAKWLEPFKEKADIGLHFNLTEGPLLTTLNQTATPLTKLILQANLRQLQKKDIINELNAQLDLFTEALGQMPHYIDGHQHIHQFPVIRDALFEVYEQRLRPKKTYLRCTYNHGSLFNFHQVAYLKQLIIQLCGGLHFKQELIKRNIPHNTTFAGIYAFEHADHYPELFSCFLDQTLDGGMIMTHPGLSGSENDIINSARLCEYNYFHEQQFLNTLTEKNITITRFNDLSL